MQQIKTFLDIESDLVEAGCIQLEMTEWLLN